MLEPKLKDMVTELLVETPLLKDLGLEPNDMHGIVVRATDKLENGRSVEAFLDFAALVLLDPTSIEFQIGLAEASLAANQPELALQTAAIVITEDPSRAEGFFLSGRACLAIGEPSLAVEDLHDAIARAEGKAELTELTRSARQLLIVAEAA